MWGGNTAAGPDLYIPVYRLPHCSAATRAEQVCLVLSDLHGQLLYSLLLLTV